MSPSVPEVPERIGAYRITREIGRGRTGVVYRGERATGDFDHVVAIKVVSPDAIEAPEGFRDQRQTLAGLSHPNIARLFDGGETAMGQPYIVMEYVEGLPLDRWITEEQPPRSARLRLFLDVAAAVAFGHVNLVAHGDVRPGNILVDAAGQPRLLDFGIARPAPEQPFAAPERLAGEPAAPLSDIYSLGRILAHMTADAGPRSELAAVSARATASDPAKRYATVEDLRADVIAFRDGFPVRAAGGGKRYALRKFVDRHRLGVGAATAAGLLLIAALGATLISNARAEASRAEAETRFQQTRAIASTLLFDVYDEVSRLSGATAARDKLAETGLSYLDGLTSGQDPPLDVRLEVGRGYTRLAQVTGSGGESQLGKLADSNVLLGKAEAVLKRAYAEQPDNPDVRRAYANLLVEQSGVNLYNNNQIALARRQALAAKAMLEPLARSQPEAARLYAMAMQSEGDSYSWDDDYVAARRVLLDAETFMGGLPAPLAADLGVRKTRSAVLRLLAEAQHNLHDDAGAIVSLDKAVAINEGLLAEAPRDPGLSRKLSMSLWYRAVVLREADRKRDALASIDRAVSLARAGRALDPKDAGALHLFGVVSEVQAQILADLGRFAESYAVGREVVDAHRRTVAQGDGAAGARRSLATTLITIGGAHYNGGDYVQACAHWREADGIFRKLQDEGVLTGHDRENTWPEVRTYVTRNCEGGPPRAGMRRPL